jgi:hypothetical protein
MNIIWGNHELASIEDKYTVLELDTFLLETEDTITAYCVLSEIPAPTLINLDHYKQMHDKLLENYRDKQFEFVAQMAEQLEIRFGEDMREYYQVMKTRAEELQASGVPDDWKGYFVSATQTTV